MKKSKLVALTLALFMVALAVSPVPIGAQGAPGGSLTVPINTSQLLGTLTVTGFQLVNGQVMAVGTIVGTLLTGVNAGTTFVRRVTIPVLDITQGGTCEILTLTLGPLDLDLLGLMVHLDRVVLNITAEPGPGNLLGNLLCAIAGLLDPGPGLATNLQRLVELLNRLLSLL